MSNEDKTQKEKFTKLVSGCLKEVIPDWLLKERLDQETLETIGLIQSKSAFQTKCVKTKTKLYYKQQKFNLLREENEGYAKLLTELASDTSSAVNTLQNIKSLIGCFDLDPNRVLDIILESFERRPDLDTFYIPLIKNYINEREMLCHMIGHKFHFYQQTAEVETPQSLYKETALLLHNDLIDLDALYPHLMPSDTDIIELHKRNILEAKQYARKFNIVSLAEKSPEDKEKEDMDSKNEQFINNQKLGLIQALLEIHNWPHALALLSRLPPYFATSYEPVAKALCKLSHIIIDPAYRRYNGLPKAVLKSHHRESPKTVMKCAETYQEVATVALPMIFYLGPQLHHDPVLMVKLLRISKSFMHKWQHGKKPTDLQDMYFAMLTLIDEVILPSLTMLDGNCCMSEEIWGLLKLLPYEFRYRLYGQWKNDACNSQSLLIRQKADCIEKAKYFMKRLTKENVKPLGRQIGKLSHNNPGVIFEYVLSQIQTYDNFIGPVVDSLKYLTSLSYDVLACTIIEALANPEREKMKYDDTSLSLWLQSLTCFAGAISKKYQIELAGILQYTVNQLKAGKSYDLLLLREVVTKMAGIEISEEITDFQLEAMAGGENLRSEGGYFTQIRNTKKSSSRLKDALIEHDLALPMCFLISQQRNCIIYKEGGDRHLKLIGKLYDQCQDTLVQFGTFLSMQMSTDEFIKKLPPIDELVGTYHVSADTAFFLSRPGYTHAINNKYDELRKIDKNDEEKSTTQQKIARYIEATEHVMAGVVESVQPLYTQKIWDELSPQFYVTFWSLTMYEIEVPTAAYRRQKQQIKNQITAIDDNSDLVHMMSKKKKEIDRCNALLDKLKDEEDRQKDHVDRVLARLKKEREMWFSSRGSTKNETITQFLQLCIFPRCCFSSLDAVYCAKFIHILHQLETPNFSTLICYDRIFCDVTNTVTCCTENEAHRYGRFLCAALNTIMKWHADKQLYEKECAQFPGFVTIFRKGADSNNKADRLEYENYRHVCHKWHYRITKAMVACLESGNYVQIRNALIVLTKILPHYPRIQQFGQALERRVERIKEDEKDKRPDIYAVAVGYSGQLRLKMSTWVAEHEFHVKEKEGKQKAASKSLDGASTSTDIKKDTENSKKDDSKKEQREVKEKRSSENKKGDGKETKNDVKELNGKTVSTKKETGVNSSKASSSKDKDTREKKEDKISQAKDKSDDRNRSHEKEEKERGRDKLDDSRSQKEKSHISEKKEREKDKEREQEKLKAYTDERNKEKKKEDKSHREERYRDEKEKERRREEKREEREKYREEKSHRAHDKSRDDQRELKHPDRSPSVTSQSSQSRRSADDSPKQQEDREHKRRKTETPSSSRVTSPTHDKEREKERKLDRKRDRSSADMDGGATVEVKRRKEESSSRSGKLNGENDTPKEKDRSRHGDKEKHDDGTRSREKDIRKSEEKKSKKEAKDHESSRERKEKHSSSSKKSKK